MSKESFYADLQAYFNSNVAREIFKSDIFSVCNMSDYCYAVFPYAKANGYQCGLIVSPDSVASLIENEVAFATTLARMSPQEKAKITFAADEHALEVFKKYKRQTELYGPSSDVDLEMEQRLAGKGIETSHTFRHI